MTSPSESLFPPLSANSPQVASWDNPALKTGKLFDNEMCCLRLHDFDSSYTFLWSFCGFILQEYNISIVFRHHCLGAVAVTVGPVIRRLLVLIPGPVEWLVIIPHSGQSRVVKIKRRSPQIHSHILLNELHMLLSDSLILTDSRL